MVIEAVFEDIKIKHAVIKELEQVGNSTLLQLALLLEILVIDALCDVVRAVLKFCVREAGVFHAISLRNAFEMFDGYYIYDCCTQYRQQIPDIYAAAS
jgi:predicted nucleic acid-binding protein